MSSIDLEFELKRSLEKISARFKIAPNLLESISYSLLSSGKRIRPRLMLAAAETVALPTDTVLPAALALEMLHCFTLIHDDLPCMDDDDFRRGRPSNHKVYGEGLALLAGDGLISVAFASLLEACERKGSIRAVSRFNEAFLAVVSGQAAELLLTEKSTLEQMTQMHAQKTGALFSAAILIPMDLAGVEENSEKGRGLSHFASELGLAFQIADDLEDAATEEVSPTSILHYIPAEKARQKTLERLENVSRSLERSWGDRTKPLLYFSNEIAKKIQATV